jgi:hypothetical protein
MNCHSSVKPRQRVEFSDMAEVQAIALILDRHVKMTQAETGVDPETAASIVARKFRAGANTIINLLRCKNGVPRVKSVCFSLGSRIIRAAIADIERQQKQLEEERARLMALAVYADPSALAEVEEGLAIVRQGLARMRGRS